MKYFAANWKLNKGPEATRKYFAELTKGVSQSHPSERTLIFFPSAICLEATAELLRDSKIQFGMQNCFTEAKGAFTGENSAEVLKEIGGQWVLIGHSERRTHFHEDDKLLSRKVALVQSLGLKPMLCIGETLDERQAMETGLVLEMQLRRGLSFADKAKPLVIAYEPVWAIGTGKVATTQQILEAHEHIRKILVQLEFPHVTPILYGGSVKLDNASELIAIPHVDGFLIGGASLEVKTFLEIASAI